MSRALIEPLSAKLRTLAARRVAAAHLPGMALGAVSGDELVWSDGIGFADVAGGRRPDADTVYRVASISKTFTATAVLQLRDGGKLRLDDPVVRFIPEFARIQARHCPVEEITLRRLLCHHSGLITEGPFDYWHSMEFPTMDAILAALPQTAAVIAPDSAAKYGNLAYALLGEVVARVSGRPFAGYVQQEIFAPLGMASSSFAPNAELLARKATGYDEHPYDDEPPPVRHTETNGIAAAAGLYTTVRDLATWISAQLRADGGCPVLAGETLAEMQHPQHVDPTWTTGFGLGWMTARKGERFDVGHGGSIHGFITQISFNVSRRLGVIVLTNQGRHTIAAETATELMDVLVEAHDREGGIPAAAADERPVPTPEAWKPLLGRYRMAGTEVQIECRGGRLRLETFPAGGRSLHAPAWLEHQDAPDHIRVIGGRGAGEVLRFLRTTAGDVTAFTLAGFVYARMQPATPGTAL